MRENYYKSERKKKQAQNNRMFLLSSIAVLVCVGVMTTAIVMYSTVGKETTATGKNSSVYSELPVSSVVSSEPVSSEEISSVIVSSQAVSSEAVSSEAVSSEAVSSEPASSAPVSSAAVSSKAVSSAASASSAVVDKIAVSSAAPQTPNNLIAEFDFSKPVTESAKVPLSYFDDAVLIGESRADGLVKYTALQNHITSLAKTSCTANMVLEGDSAIIKKIEAKPGKYKKAYIMLGLNEISHDYTTIMGRYGKIIDRIRKCQPDIVIYLQTVLPITKYVQNNHSYLRKEKIVEFNKRLAKLAVEKKVYLVDPTSVFIGSDGYMVNAARASANNLTGEYHFNGTYSQKWLDYLCAHTVK